jgi:hypothetical protein
MSILPTVGVQQSIEQIPVLIQASPPFNPSLPAVSTMALAISEVEKIREVHPVSLSREDAVGSGEEEDATDEKQKDQENEPDAVYPRSKGHLDLRV